MRIQEPGKRASDSIMQRFAARHLGIYETDADLDAATAKDEPVVKTADAKKTANSCPECGGPLQVKGNMERCACGYGQATAASVKQAETTRKASETSVAEYYKKIFPDDYVSELTGDPDSGKAGEKVEYGTLDAEKPVGSNVPGGSSVTKAHRVTVREIRGFGEEQKDVPQAGDCEVPDKDPTPPKEKPNGAVNEAGDAKMMSGDSANSVGGPGDIPAGEKPNGKANEAGDVKVPDLGVPKGATRRGLSKKAGGACQKCGTGLNQAGQCPTCNSSAEQAQAQASKMIPREVIARWCPECAEEMKRAGVKSVSAAFIAKKIAERAAEARK